MATSAVTNNFVNGTAADADAVDQNFADLTGFLNNDVVHRDGTQSMTGQLALFADPTADAHAVRKAYVDGPFVYASGAVSQVWTTNVASVCKFSTEVTDTHNAYNLSTGIFTCPKAGIYLVEFVSSPADTETWLHRVFLATTARTYTGPRYTPSMISSNEAAIVPWTIPVKCALNDTIAPQLDLALSGSSATRSLGNHLSITWLHG